MSEDLKPSYEELEAELVQAKKRLRHAGLHARTQNTGAARAGRLEERLQQPYQSDAEQWSDQLAEMSEVHRSAANVAQSEALHRAILDSSTEYAIISLDRDGMITSWNEGAVQTMGWTEEEMLGKPAHVFSPLSRSTLAFPNRRCGKRSRLAAARTSAITCARMARVSGPMA